MNYAEFNRDLSANYNILNKDHPRKRHVEKWVFNRIPVDCLDHFFECVTEQCQYYPTTYQLDAIATEHGFPDKDKSQTPSIGNDEIIGRLIRLRDLFLQMKDENDREWDMYHAGQGPRPEPLRLSGEEWMFFTRNQDALAFYERQRADGLITNASKELQQCLTFHNQLTIDGGNNDNRNVTR